MLQVEEKREKIIASVRNMDDKQIELLNDFISKIALLQKDSWLSNDYSSGNIASS
jgi:hypothetical protein